MRGTVFYSLLKMLEDKNFSGFILENVDNLSGPNHREDFKLMIEALGRNYHVTHFVESPHNMDGDYSIQHRQRVFIVGLNKKQFDNPGDKYMSSEEDRRTHWKKAVRRVNSTEVTKSRRKIRRIHLIWRNDYKNYSSRNWKARCRFRLWIT